MKARVILKVDKRKCCEFEAFDNNFEDGIG